jgi:hypothetical protein
MKVGVASSYKVKVSLLKKEIVYKFKSTVVNSINCFTTVNHRLAGPGIMVKLHLLFVGREVC